MCVCVLFSCDFIRECIYVYLRGIFYASAGASFNVQIQWLKWWKIQSDTSDFHLASLVGLLCKIKCSVEHDGFGVLLPLILLDMEKFDTILVLDLTWQVRVDRIQWFDPTWFRSKTGWKLYVLCFS